MLTVINGDLRQCKRVIYRRWLQNTITSFISNHLARIGSIGATGSLDNHPILESSLRFAFLFLFLARFDL